MDYDRIFENDLQRKFFYTDYPGAKMMVGKISLGNAVARLSKNEFYTLVTYNEGEVLPEQYIAVSELKSDDGTLFATINPNTRFNYICKDSGIQVISRLPDLEKSGPRYLLGPGPDTVELVDLINEQYNEYLNQQTVSSKRGR